MNIGSKQVHQFIITRKIFGLTDYLTPPYGSPYVTNHRT